MTQPPDIRLTLPIDGRFKISSGWLYTPSDIAVHGVDKHRAIDFQAVRGAPVLAAADGWALASYEEYALRNADGNPKRLRGKPIWFGSGLVVQIWHGHGAYTQYAHLDSADPAIPFHPPQVTNENLWPNTLRLPVKELVKKSISVRVRVGQQIGTIGMTGMGFGRRTYEDWKSGKTYSQYEKDHLHFVLFGRRAPRSREAKRFDPFGIYGTVDQYPQDVWQWSKLPKSFWK